MMFLKGDGRKYPTLFEIPTETSSGKKGNIHEINYSTTQSGYEAAKLAAYPRLSDPCIS
jgi:hypothetical protein